MTNSFKAYYDKQMWDYVAPCPVAHAAGVSMCCDLRSSTDSNPNVVLFASSSNVYTYNKIQKSWRFVTSGLGMAGTFGAGSACVFAPSFGMIGTVGAGSTTTKIVLSAATINGSAISAVGLNMFANQGNGSGFKVRVIGYGSGKIEERLIVGNTASATPTLSLDSALSFTPAANDRIEILGGRFFFLNAGTLASGSWKSFESPTNIISTLVQTNLPATVGTDSSLIALDELYNPYNRKPGEGFLVGTATYNGAALGCLQATAIAAGTITGQSSGGDVAVLANEYRNFQIRIVEDTVNVTAVGQRRLIASHTAGPSAVYTLGSNWTVTPSANAKFVIELPNQIICRSSATTTVYVYNYTDYTQNNGTTTIANNAWSTTYYGVAGNACGAGVTQFGGYGIVPDTDKNARQSMIHTFRGGASTALDVLNIAGGTTGSWENGATYDGAVQSITTGSCGKYAPYCCEGKFGYMNFYTANATNQMLKYDVKNRTLLPFTSTEWLQTGTAAASDRVATYPFFDGTDTYSIVMLLAHTSSVAMEIMVQAP